MVCVGETKAAVMNELISLFDIQSNIPETGLKKLTFGAWEGMSEPLDEFLLQSLAFKCSSLTEL